VKRKFAQSGHPDADAKCIKIIAVRSLTPKLPSLSFISKVYGLIQMSAIKKLPKNLDRKKSLPKKSDGHLGKNYPGSILRLQVL
jgi:hypothetical protein